MQGQRESEDGTGSRNGNEPHDTSLPATEAALEIRKQQQSLPGTVSDPEKIQVQNTTSSSLSHAAKGEHFAMRRQPAAAARFTAQKIRSRAAYMALLKLA